MLKTSITQRAYPAACRREFQSDYPKTLRQRDSETAEFLSTSIKQYLPAHPSIGLCAAALLTICCQRPLSPTGT
ncbi:hypothetical protein BHK98_09805 [Hornefia porci]|uniref:Uncharacterized protein n=1 Tax=Hornefia porci TaxID=2652292 RepID=A0A1Q9JJK0_9FIRM|nr:hypothetical protein BHK98_09805 [Hornefia porci]